MISPELTHIPMSATSVDTQTKALTINMDTRIYGTFAEIGAGQEIAGWFFKVGGAAGTVAKTMSAYDMTVSDDIYGKASQYVSDSRLHSMLDHEYSLLNQRLASKFGSERTFFALADTVSARNFKGTNECHGWIGIRHQERPNEEPVDIVLHVNLLDTSNFAQQETLGILGVNLVYAAFFLKHDLFTFLKSLTDDLGNQKVEIDIITFKGGAFSQFDQKDIAIELIYSGLARAVVLSKEGTLQQPSSILRKKCVLVERGSYRILNALGLSSIEKAKSLVEQSASKDSNGKVFINELSIRSVHSDQDILKDEMKSLVKSVISECDQYLMISAFTWYYDISKYLRRYSKEPLGFVMGITTVMKLFNEEFYDESSGSLLEALGKLLAIGAKVYAYPMQTKSIQALSLTESNSTSWSMPDLEFTGLNDTHPIGASEHLFRYLLQSNYLVPL